MRNFMRLAAGLTAIVLTAAAADKQILLIAGRPSHPPGQHEHNAGVLILAKWLNTVPGVHATTSLSGAWPDADVLDKADAIFVFADGGEGHPVFQQERPAAISKAAARGAGLMFFHYATEPPAQRGHPEMLDWIGGHFAVNYSVNPIYEGTFTALPTHAVTRGVKPFRTRDEWYYNFKFRENRSGFTPILVTTPPPDTVKEDGLRSGNPDVRSKAGQPQIVGWVLERQNGGRSAGITGGHFHANLGNDDFRKLVLNSLLWVAQAEVPANGVEVTVTPEDLTQNLDPKQGRRPQGTPPPAVEKK